MQSAISSLQASVMGFVQMVLLDKISSCPGNSQGRKSSQEKEQVQKGLRKPQLRMIYLEHVFSTVLAAIGRTALPHKPQGKSILCQMKETAHIQNLRG